MICHCHGILRCARRQTNIVPPQQCGAYHLQVHHCKTLSKTCPGAHRKRHKHEFHIYCWIRPSIRIESVSIRVDSRIALCCITLHRHDSLSSVSKSPFDNGRSSFLTCSRTKIPFSTFPPASISLCKLGGAAGCNLRASWMIQSKTGRLTTSRCAATGHDCCASSSFWTRACRCGFRASSQKRYVRVVLVVSMECVVLG